MNTYQFSTVADMPDDVFDNSLCVYLVSRDESENNDLRRIDSFMDILKINGRKACLKVVFGFGGYDDDPRKIYLIEGARRFMALLLDKHPNFGYFIIPDGQAIFACLLPTLDVAKGTMPIETVQKTMRQITDGIRRYGDEIGDVEGKREAIRNWQAIIKN